MAKYRVKLSLSERDVLNKVEFGGIVNGKMTANPNLTSPLPTMADLLSVTTDLDTAFKDSKHGVLSTTTLNNAESAYDTLLTALGNYVESVAQGSKEIIESAGMTATAASHSPVTM